MTKAKPQVCELCCGPGGMALGFSKRFEIVHAIDEKSEVVKTYGSNHPETDVRRLDIRNLTGVRGDFDGITGIIGGPPCQGSSIINTKRRNDDPRNALMLEFMRIVDETRPKFFVMENVPGVARERKDAVIDAGKKAGYIVTSVFLNAADYGAAQTRKRWIVIGIRGREWHRPAPQGARTIREALAGIRDNWGFMRSRSDTLETLKLAVPNEWRSMTGDFKGMIRLEWDQPSPAIVNLKKVYMVHPSEIRNITLAEAAALQGFPPDYIWCGTESQIAWMIAQAMPSEMATSIAESL